MDIHPSFSSRILDLRRYLLNAAAVRDSACSANAPWVGHDVGVNLFDPKQIRRGT